MTGVSSKYTNSIISAFVHISQFFFKLCKEIILIEERFASNFTLHASNDQFMLTVNPVYSMHDIIFKYEQIL